MPRVPAIRARQCADALLAVVALHAGSHALSLALVRLARRDLGLFASNRRLANDVGNLGLVIDHSKVSKCFYPLLFRHLERLIAEALAKLLSMFLVRDQVEVL